MNKIKINGKPVHESFVRYSRVSLECSRFASCRIDSRNSSWNLARSILNSSHKLNFFGAFVFRVCLSLNFQQAASILRAAQITLSSAVQREVPLVPGQGRRLQRQRSLILYAKPRREQMYKGGSPHRIGSIGFMPDHLPETSWLSERLVLLPADLHHRL